VSWEIEKRDELAHSFRLLVSTPERLDNTIIGKNHKLDRYEISSDGDEHTLFWKGLNSDVMANLAIEFQGHIKLTSDGIIFDGNIKINLIILSMPFTGPILAILQFRTKKKNQTG
jgi:hypothetical protein